MQYIIAIEGMTMGTDGLPASVGAYFKVESEMGMEETRRAIEESLAKSDPSCRVTGFVPMFEEGEKLTSDEEWKKFTGLIGNMLRGEN